MKFEEMVKMPQNTLKKALAGELNRMRYRTRTKKGFLYAKGKLPVLLVAHLDTVHKEPVKTICYSDNGIIMSPEGIGGDDRAGVFMIMEIVKKYRCHVLFCEDEEIGGIGAREFAASGIKPNVNFIVELDRRGSNDAVFYECDNPEFTAFVEGFGFKENFGSFSDISVIAPALGIAAVNISAGYFGEHSKHEYVDMNAVANNIERVGKMAATKTDKFEYIKAVYRSTWGKFGSRYYEQSFDFDGYFGGAEIPDEKMLMMLPDSCHVRVGGGKLDECDGQYFIDESGQLYEYLFDMDVAVEAEGEPCTENDMPVRFNKKKATAIEVVSQDYLFDMEEAAYFATKSKDVSSTNYTLDDIVISLLREKANSPDDYRIARDALLSYQRTNQMSLDDLEEFCWENREAAMSVVYG